MTDPLALAGALLLGLGGSTHCIGMCGGIGAALGVAAQRNRVLMAFSYNFGRVLSYALLGALFGGALQWFGVSTQPYVPAFGLWLRVIAGLMIIAMGLYVGGWWFGLTRLEKLGAPIWRRIQPYTTKLLPPRTLPAAWLLGMLWGFLPCGLIYSTLSWAAARGNAVESAQLMAVFGLGTLPAMAAVTLGGEQLRTHFQRPMVRQGAGIFLVLIGIVTIAVPWQHAGHGNTHQPHHNTLH
jgi:sulfite exporter TauE/SafE